jgi:hypothetical protein
MKNTKISVILSVLMVAFVLLINEAAFAGPAQIIIVNNNAPGVGLNDPTPAAPVGGNPGTTLGEQRMIAFEHAARIWSARLDSNVPIRIRAQLVPLAATTLGSAGALSIVRNFPNAPLPNTWYHVALGNALAGVDLVPANPANTSNPNGDDINVNFNSNFNFYLGLDNNHGPLNDLVAVLLHEFAHGLGFSQFSSLTSGALFNGLPDVYNSRLLDTTIGLYWSQMTNAQRLVSSTNSGRVVWDGNFVTNAVPSVLTLGVPLLRVNSPSAIANVYAVGAASFGPTIANSPVTGDVVRATDAANAAGPTTFDGCTAITNAAAIAGKIALIDRGACGFTIKVKNAQDAGAIAVIIADNAVGSPPPGLGGTDDTIVIPAVRITLQDGNTIKTQLTGGATVNVTLAVDFSVYAGADTLNRMRVNAPSPVVTGSSISHYDPIAFRNLLMEPAINPDLTHQVKPPVDLTFTLFRDIGWTFPDADGDGIVDDEDCNPNSDTRPTIFIGGINTGVPNTLFENGCTISDKLNEIATASNKNHGQYVSAIANYTNELKDSGLITGKQKGAIQSAAAKLFTP